MNDKTSGSRGPRRAGALAVCRGRRRARHGVRRRQPPPRRSASAPTYAQELALAQCMRGHGVPNFPDPSASGGYTLTSNGSLEGDGAAVKH